MQLFRCHWKIKLEEPQIHEVVQTLYTFGAGRHLIRWLYRALITLTKLSLSPLREKWEDELTRSLHDKEWEKVLARPHKISRGARLKLVQFFILHRAYLTPQKINSYYPGSNAACPRCALPDADFQHMIWGCPALHVYWTSITTLLATLTGYTDLHSWGAITLGAFDRPKQRKLTTRFIDLAFILALKLVTGTWKAKNAPHYKHWCRELINWATAEHALLLLDESRGLRKTPLAAGWDALLLQFQSCIKDDNLPP